LFLFHFSLYVIDKAFALQPYIDLKYNIRICLHGFMFGIWTSMTMKNSHLLQVTNYTYTCYFPGQELYVRIISNGWLHKGALVCPPCEELCQVKVQTRGNCFIYSPVNVIKKVIVVFLLAVPVCWHLGSHAIFPAQITVH
jgi:hypothetical protein